MRIFNLFNKNNHQEVIEEKQELTIPVRDLKTHMVNEFNRARSLIEEIKVKDEVINQFEEDELKHNATMVLVDEYRNRLDYQDNEIELLKQKLDEQTEIRRSIEEENNTLIIQKSIMQSRVDDVDSHIESVSKEKINQFCVDLLNDVELSLSLVKGNVSKTKFYDILNYSIKKEKLNGINE